MTREELRLEEARERKAHWKRWGPRAYRWSDDGILGISDNHQRLCFAIALWNGQAAILKERLFGLTSNALKRRFGVLAGAS